MKNKNRVKLSFIQRMIQGAIGKEYVIKHYRYGIIKTKFPDMTKIIASPGQRKCRNLFREAVVYAKSVIADKEKKKEWQKRLRRRNGVYNDAVKAYMLKEKLVKERDRLLTNKLIRNAFINAAPTETFVGPTPAVTVPRNTNKYETLFIAPG
ncbi:MAG: hypothetical protein ABI760_22580 [Ferruginibacter sp.]